MLEENIGMNMDMNRNSLRPHEEVASMKNMFEIKIEDKYQRSYLLYDGMDQLVFRIGGKGTDRDAQVLVPQELKDSVLELAAPLKQYGEEYGSTHTSGNFKVQITLLTGNDFLYKYLDNDSKSANMASSIEAFLFDTYPELRTVYNEAVSTINQREKDAEAEKQRMFEQLSMDTIRGKYPNLFDENGEFTKEGIQTVLASLDAYASKKGPQM